MKDSDCLRQDDRLGVSLGVEEILDYWRFEPVSSPGGFNREAGDPETVLVSNKTTTAMMRDVSVFPIASQIDFSSGGLTCKPNVLQRQPTETQCSALTTLQSVPKGQQHSKSIKIELDLSQCKSEILSKCTAVKVEDLSPGGLRGANEKVFPDSVLPPNKIPPLALQEVKDEDPIWAYYSQIESGMIQTNTIPVKTESFENATVGVKVDSEIKVEDAISACYFAKQEKEMPNVEKPIYAAHLKEEPVDFSIVGTKSRSSFGPGLSTSKENAVQPTVTERCDQNRNDHPMTPDEVLKTLQQSGKNSTVNRYVKQETVNVKNEDPIWANYHMHEGNKDLNPKYEHSTLLLPSPEENHHPLTSEEMLSLIGIRQPICKVAMPSSRVEPEPTVTSDPAGPSQPISHQSSKKQRLEKEPSGQSGLGSQLNTSKPSVPIPDTFKRHPFATSNLSGINPAYTGYYFFKCPLCDMSSVSHQQDEGKLQAEVVKGKTKDTAKPWKCCVCNAAYASHARLRVHRVLHISDLKCPECGKCLMSERTLQIHMRIHSKERPFSCKECVKSYRLPGQLNEHMNSSHSSKRDIFCPECGKCFRVKSFLDIHMNMHTGNRPYQCTDCKASFKTPSALNAHKKIHTGEKPFSCPQCGRDFRLNANLIRHMATHSADKGKVKKSGGKRSKGKKEQSDTEESSACQTQSPHLTAPLKPPPADRSQRKLRPVDN